jgi:hypothetical protein
MTWNRIWIWHTKTVVILYRYDNGQSVFHPFFVPLSVEKETILGHPRIGPLYATSQLPVKNIPSCADRGRAVAAVDNLFATIVFPFSFLERNQAVIESHVSAISNEQLSDAMWKRRRQSLKQRGVML